MPTAHLAIDFGAGSGRVMLAVLDGKPLKVRLEEMHRFTHQPLNTPSGPAWDFTTLWREVTEGIKQAVLVAKERGLELVSIGADTWGVDWTLVEPGGELLGLPHAYRDPANFAARERVLSRLADESGKEGAETLYNRTGIQPHFFNTIFQLDARKTASPGLFGVEGSKLLLLPDLLHFFLSGICAVERTNASTTSLLSLSGEWDNELLASLGMQDVQLGELVDPGAVLGPIRPELAEELGLPTSLQVVAPATHDTASAIAAVPAVDEKPGTWAYLSSGTWSLLGVEIDKPNASTEALKADFTNELGVERRVRFLRNIAGLWLIQELRHDLERQGEIFDFATLAALAEEAQPLRTLIDPNTDDLGQPGNSIKKLQAHAKQTGQPIPETPGQLARCCLESLAFCYAETIDKIESLTDHKIETIYIVGGGVNHRLLNRLTANASGRTVKLGPSEATAMGNALMQTVGLGQVASLNELRQIVANSEPVEVVEPADDKLDWQAARDRYQKLIESSH